MKKKVVKLDINDLAMKVDKAIDDNSHQELNEYKNNILIQLKNNQTSREDKSRLYYFLANIYLHKFYLSGKSQDKISSKKEALNNFFLAISLSSNLNHLYQYYTNLGNIYKSDSRFLEAIDCYEEASKVTQNEALLPSGNKLECLYAITKDKFFTDQKNRNFPILELWRVILLEVKKIDLQKSYPDEHLEQVGGQKIIKSYLKDFDKYFKKYKSDYESCHAKEELIWDLKDSFLEDSNESIKNEYSTWCSQERLLLNILNLQHGTDAFEDNLFPSSISIKEGDYILTFWQQLAQEYCSSRYVYFLYKDLEEYPSEKHISDKNNNISKPNKISCNYYLSANDGHKLLSSSSYGNLNHNFSYEIEKMKSAYAKLYNILNKMAVMVFSYIKLIDKTNCSYLKEIQENSKIKDSKIELHSFQHLPKDIKYCYPSLYAFISIYEDVCGNNNCEDYKKLKKIRDAITHGYFKLSYYKSSDSFNYKDKNIIEANYLEISIGEFKRNFRELLKLTKNIFFYAELLIKELEAKN